MVEAALNHGMENDNNIQFAMKSLETMRMEKQQQEEDELLYQQAQEAQRADEEKNFRLEKELMELEMQVCCHLKLPSSLCVCVFVHASMFLNVNNYNNYLRNMN